MSKYQEEKDATAVPSDVPKPASTDLPMIIAPNMGEKRIIKIFRIDKEKSIEIKKAILETLNASKNNKNETCSSSSKCIPSSTLDKSIKNEFTQQENKGNIISNQVKSSISRTQTLGSIIKIKREASSTEVTKKDHESKPEEVEILTYPPITNKSITELSAKIPSFDKLNTYLKEKRGNDPIVQKDVISENVEKKLSTQIETSVSIDYNQIKIKEDIANKVDEDSPNTVNNRSLKDNIKFGELFPKDSNMGKKPLVINPAKRSDLSEITSHIGTSSSYLVSNNNKNLDDSTKSCSSDNKYQINKTSLNQNSTKSLVKKLTNVPETEPENAVDLLLKTFGDGTKLNVTYFGEDEHMLDELEYDFDLDELVNEKSEKEKVCKEDNELQIDCHNSQNPPVEIKNTVELLSKSHTDNKTTEMEKINTGAIIIENKILTENEKIDLTTLQNKKLLSSPPVQIKEQKSNSTTEPEVIVIVGNSISGSTIPKKINSQEDKSNSSCKKVVKSYRKGKINLVERKKQNTIEPLKTKSGIEDKTKLTKDFLNRPKDLKGSVLNEGQSSLKQTAIELVKPKSGIEDKTKMTSEFLNRPKDLKGGVLNEGQSSLKQTAIEPLKIKSGIVDKTKLTAEFLNKPKDLKSSVLNEGQSSLKQNTIEPLKIKSGIVDRSKMTAEFLDRPKTLKVSTECTAVKMFKIEMSNPLSDSYNDEFLDKINNKNIKNIQNIQNQKPTDGDVLIHKDNVKFPTDKFHSIQESNKSFNKPDVPKSIEVDLVDEDKNCFQPKSLNCSPNKSTRPEIESSSKKNLTPIKNSEWNANAANTEKASVSACVSNTNILLKPSLKKKTDDSKGSNQRRPEIESSSEKNLTPIKNSEWNANAANTEKASVSACVSNTNILLKPSLKKKTDHSKGSNQRRPEIGSSSEKNLTPIKNSEWNANAANTEKASVSACVSNTNILLKPSLKKKTDDSKGSNQRRPEIESSSEKDLTPIKNSEWNADAANTEKASVSACVKNTNILLKPSLKKKTDDSKGSNQRRPEIESSSEKDLTPIKNSEWNANAANTEKTSVSPCVSNTNILLKPSLKKKTDDSKGSNQRNRKVSFDLSDIQKLKEDKRISCSLKPVKKGSQSQPFSNNLKKKETSAESIKVTFSNISTDCKNNEEDKTSKDIKENAEISPHFQDMKLSNESNKDIDLIVIDPENVGSQIKDVTSNDDTNLKKGLKEENNDSDDSDFIGFEESEIFNYTFDANKFRKSLKKKPKTLYDFFKKSSKPNISANKAQNQIPKVTSKTTKLVSNIISPDSDDDIKVPLKKRKIQQVENMEVEFTNSKDNSKLLKSTKNNDSLHNQSSEISNISNTEVAMTDSPIIKKRGRKPKNESNVSSDNIGISIPKKRGRKPKNWNSDCSTDDGILNKSIENPTVNNYDSTMLLLQGKDRKLIPADNTNYVPLPNDVQCGLCKEYTLRKNWNNHLGSHYGIGWIQGDSEINVESYTIVLNAMLKYQKSCKIQGFKCRMCGNMLKSALGVMTHIQTCQLSAEAKKARLGVRCEHCNNQYSVFSIPNHLKTCRSLAMKIRNKNKEVNPETELPTPETQTFTNTGRIKRKSVIKAEKIIKNVESSVHFDPDEFIQVDNSQEKEQFIKWRKEIQIHGFAKCLTKECNFTGNTFEIMKDHAKGCQTTDERCFQCKVCKYRNIDLELVKSHVIENHQTLDFNNDDHDSDTEIKFDAESEDEDTSVDDNYCEADKLFEDLVAVDVKKSVRRKSTKLEDKSKRVYKIKRNINIIQQTIQLTQFFVDTHLTSQILFDTALPRPVKGTCSKDRLPKNFQSMKFAYSSDNEFNHESGKSKPATDWMSLKQFESKQTKDELLLYIGGPIKYLAWVPISCKEMTSQYLAVVYRRCFNTFSRTIETNPKKTSILIYEIGNPNSMTDPKLLYAITIDTGPVHYLEFMPSGGYAPKINRLGLLAVGSTDFNIKIYALPIKPTTFANNTESDKNIIFLELEPAFILTLDCRKNWLNAEIYCTFQTYRIAWSEVKGHNHIVAGFSNGGVAIWDITNEEDNMNRMVKQNVINYIPICFFRDCEKGIVDIKLHYNNNLRWMAVASISRQIFVYDLKNLNRPVMISQDTGKNEVTCVDWPVIWENYNIGLGEVLATYGCVLTTMSPSGIVFKNRRSAKTVNGITSAHFNYWYNISAVGSENGDTFVEFMREMNLDITKVSNTCQKLLAYVDIVGLNENSQVQYEEYTEKKKVPTDWRIFDTDYMENYGLVFGPLSKYTKEKITLVTNKKRNPGVNRFAFVQVNCVRFNLNQNVKNILAIGYENGTIRIMKVKP